MHSSPALPRSHGCTTRCRMPPMCLHRQKQTRRDTASRNAAAVRRPRALGTRSDRHQDCRRPMQQCWRSGGGAPGGQKSCDTTRARAPGAPRSAPSGPFWARYGVLLPPHTINQVIVCLSREHAPSRDHPWRVGVLRCTASYRNKHGHAAGTPLDEHPDIHAA